jgi:hypothetical protein
MALAYPLHNSLNVPRMARPAARARGLEKRALRPAVKVFDLTKRARVGVLTGSIRLGSLFVDLTLNISIINIR